MLDFGIAKLRRDGGERPAPRTAGRRGARASSLNPTLMFAEGEETELGVYVPHTDCGENLTADTLDTG